MLFYREAMIQRIGEAINPKRKQEQKNLSTVIKQTGVSVSQIVERFDKMLPKSDKEISIVLQRLTRAGFRNEHAVKVFYGTKVLCPLLLCAIAAVTGLANLGPFFVYLVALGLGFLGPDFWLGGRSTRGRKRLRADFLMCLICW